MCAKLDSKKFLVKNFRKGKTLICFFKRIFFHIHNNYFFFTQPRKSSRKILPDQMSVAEHYVALKTDQPGLQKTFVNATVGEQ